MMDQNKFVFIFRGVHSTRSLQFELQVCFLKKASTEIYILMIIGRCDNLLLFNFQSGCHCYLKSLKILLLILTGCYHHNKLLDFFV